MAALDRRHRDCQDTRQEVLIRDARRVTLTPDGCKVLKGEWLDPYTGELLTDPPQLDVDHVVPLSYAHRTGGSKWDKARKAAFANFLGDARHLAAVKASANRQNGDKGPSKWRPRREALCAYADAWHAVTWDWDLTIPAADAKVIQEMFGTCR